MIYLREARKRAGLTVEELSEKTGAACSTIQHWQSGRTSPVAYYIPLIVEALGCTYEEIFHGFRPLDERERFVGRRVRESMGVSREQMARRMDVAKRTVYLWETGRERPDEAKCRRMAEALGVSPADLFEKVEAENAETMGGEGTEAQDGEGESMCSAVVRGTSGRIGRGVGPLDEGPGEEEGKGEEENVCD